MKHEDGHSETKLTHFINFYRLTADDNQRNLAGAAPLLPHLEKTEQLTSFDDLQKQMPV